MSYWLKSIIRCATVSIQQITFLETALPKVHNCITLNIAQGKVTANTLLDLTAAFDTANHNTLIERLPISYGISDTALTWVSSYVSEFKFR